MTTWVNSHGEFEDDFEPYDWGVSPDYSPLSEAERQRTRYRVSARPVVCIDTGTTFPSVAAAAASVGSDGGDMRRAIKRGWRFRGMRWRYA